MKGAPRSSRFDDVYFSAQDGLEETRHVFLNGNDLPKAWGGRDHFVIAETGFGTGLNFLAVWELFLRHSESHQTLEFISFEQFPMTKLEIEAALEPFYFGPLKENFLESYPDFEDGDGRVILRVIEGDINKKLPELSMKQAVDCWFLDGFTPAKNPEMWTQTVFDNIARLSLSGTSFATFTAAGFVKRGLQKAGFMVEKVPGFGTKRDMLRGNFAP